MIIPLKGGALFIELINKRRNWYGKKTNLYSLIFVIVAYFLAVFIDPLVWVYLKQVKSDQNGVKLFW